MDTMTPEQRHLCMSHIRGRDTLPERVMRRIVCAMGFRPVANAPKLPGKPDLVMPKWRKVIFVNGCFWHGHTCGKCRIPKTNTEFWTAKITRNKRRDRRNVRDLKRDGWEVLTVWECELEKPERLRKKLNKFLPPTRANPKSRTDNPGPTIKLVISPRGRMHFITRKNISQSALEDWWNRREKEWR